MTKLLKSVNIQDDIYHPERVSHYVPTSKSKVVVSAVMRPGANVVVAPYGSGKSLAASLGAISVRNSSQDKRFLSEMSNKICRIDQEVASEIDERINSKIQGKVVLLNGFVSDITSVFCNSLKFRNQNTMQDVFGKINS